MITDTLAYKGIVLGINPANVYIQLKITRFAEQ